MADWLNEGALVSARIWIRQHWLGIMAVLFLLACVSYAAGCGASQRVISAQATVHRANQADRFDAYAALDEHCGELHGGDREAYRVCMRPAREVARFADSYRRSLEGAQSLVDAGDQDGFDAMLPDLASAAARLVQAATAAGVPVPNAVRQVADMIGGE